MLSAACGRCRTACPSVCVFLVVGVFPAGSRGLLKLSQAGRNWERCLPPCGRSWTACRPVSEAERCWGMFSAENNGSDPAGQRRYFYFRITVSVDRWQFLTFYIKDVIISVAMITKMLFVTRPPNLRYKPLLPLWV